MYLRPQNTQVTRQSPRRSDIKVFGSPISGWIANRSLSNPEGAPQGAAVLDNFFPTAVSVMLRRGKVLHQTIGSTDVTSLFTYNFGNNEHLFGANSTTIYDVEANTVVYGGNTSGYWNTVQFGTTGASYLIGVNGQNTGFIYNGTKFYPYIKGGIWTINYAARTTPYVVGATITGSISGATAVIHSVTVGSPVTIGSLEIKNITGTFVSGEILNAGVNGSATSSSLATSVVPGADFGAFTSADMEWVWVYKEALYFLRKNSLSFYYLPVGAAGGVATEISLAGVADLGGNIKIGHSWSLDSGQGGGLSDQCVFITDEGQVIVYQGISPAPSQGWTLVGVYRIGALLGNRAFVKAGADLLISTTIGMVSLANAIQRDIAATAPQAVSYPINDAWAQAIDLRGMQNWQAIVWPEAQMIAVAPPKLIGGSTPVIFAVNANTMAWARFTNWDALCFATFNGNLYFGSPLGKVYQANVSGSDDGQVYTGAYIPLFEDYGSPMQVKVPKMGRAVTRSLASVSSALAFRADYDVSLDTPPSAGLVSGTSVWGAGIWGSGIWGAVSDTVIDQQWVSLAGYGYTGSMAYQVTSGAVGPLDTEIVRLEMSYTTGEVAS